MQEKAFQYRDAQYLLLKAPTALDKSRELVHQESDSGRSRKINRWLIQQNQFKRWSFFANWRLNDNYNLCTPGNDGGSSKVKSFNFF